MGNIVPYWSTKFEENQSTRMWLKVTIINWCKEEKEEQFSKTYISQTTKLISFKFGM